MTPDEILEQLKQQFGDALAETEVKGTEVSLRTIERVLQSEGRTSPAFRPQPRATSSDYPGRPATHSNQLHQLDLIGPRYLKGSRRQWFFLVYRDSYDQAVYVEFQPKPKLEDVLAFVVRAWQRLGLPDRLQVDNSELFGLTSHPGSLSRFVRLALWVGVELTFIPEHEPWRNGAIEWFNGWLQERVLSIPLRSAAQVHREVGALMMTCWEEHVHPGRRAGGAHPMLGHKANRPEQAR